ncbi:MAG: OpgC domain-containing protein [Proteobacteria bacterium]|nr:OpgC domain-containing protein [Pseudomonadota bacterium]
MAFPQQQRPRDFRIDFLRGLALLVIFVDHIPQNLFALVTLRNFGFSDASEWFIFLSGYAGAYVFALRRARNGYFYAAIQMLRRVWTLYVAHIFVFVLYTAQVSFTASSFNNPLYFDELNLGAFLQEPHVAVMEALLLRFQPPYLDILPLYIVLMLIAPLAFALPARYGWTAIAGSGVLYLCVQLFHWQLQGYPDNRPWTFNPLAWQALFALGALLGRAAALSQRLIWPNRWLTGFAVVYLAFALVISMSWTIAGVVDGFPALLDTELFPLDKANLSPWRFSHILAVVYIVWIATRPDQPLFNSRFARPIVLCGANSLNIFCLGVFLSMLGDVVLDQLGRGLGAQVLVNLVGCALMIAVAYSLDRAKALDRPAPAARPEAA